MNNKGYTLMEVIVSIMILSIATLTLAGSFTTIIHFMTKSNQAKEASNNMYGVIEGNEDNNTVTFTQSTDFFGYNIYKKNDAAKQPIVSTKGYLYKYKSSLSDDVTLKVIDKEEILKLEDDEDYKMLMNDGIKKLEERITSNESQCSLKADFNTCIINNVFNDGTLENIKFPKKFLPEKVLGVDSLYVDVIYPYDNDKENELIFVNSYNNHTITGKINVFLIYFNNSWYCYNGVPANSGYYLEVQNSKVGLYKNGIKITNYVEFIDHIISDKDSLNKSSWLKLYPNRKYVDGDTKNVWQPIEDVDN